MKDDAVTPDPNDEEDDIFYCSLYDLEIFFSQIHIFYESLTSVDRFFVFY